MDVIKTQTYTYFDISLLNTNEDQRTNWKLCKQHRCDQPCTEISLSKQTNKYTEQILVISREYAKTIFNSMISFCITHYGQEILPRFVFVVVPNTLLIVRMKY